MTKHNLISANVIADIDRYTSEYLPRSAETLTMYDGTPVIVTFDPTPMAGDWPYNHTFVAEFPSSSAARAWQTDDRLNSEERERLRDAVFADHNVVLQPAFDPCSSSTPMRTNTDRYCTTEPL